VFIAGKLCDPCLSALRWFVYTMQGAIQVLGFTFTFTFSEFHSLLQRVRIACNAGRCNSQSDSVRPSVYLSVTLRCFEDMIVRFSASGRKIILVSGEV